MMPRAIPDGVYALVSTFYTQKSITEQVDAARKIAQMKGAPVYLAMDGVVVEISPKDSEKTGVLHWFSALRQAIVRR